MFLALTTGIIEIQNIISVSNINSISLKNQEL